MADSCDHGNESLFPYQEENFSVHLTTTIFQEDLCSVSKLATLYEASYVSRERRVMFMYSLKVQKRLWRSPNLLLNRYRALLPVGKNGRILKLITQLQVM